MKEKIGSVKVPYQYAMCLNRQCPQTNTCLRRLAEQSVSENIEHWVIISPKPLANIKGDYPHYRPNIKVRYARGFIGISDYIPHKQMQAVVAHLMGYLSRRTYYRIRKGERLLSPAEQQYILNILKNCGVTYPEKFDAYIEDYDWRHCSLNVTIRTSAWYD